MYAGSVVGAGLLIFDGDDTLWVVEPLYDEARALVRTYIESLEMDGARWEEFQRKIDIGNVQVLGLSSTRFPTSCIQAYEHLAASPGLRDDEGAKLEIWRRAQTVFQRKAPLVEGAEEVLRCLVHSFTLALLTQGEEKVQVRRIFESGLEGYFAHVAIVERKGSSSFEDVLRATGASREESWSIGNSLPSDIVPALSCGMGAVWVDAHVWEYESRETQEVKGHLLRAERLKDVPQILMSPVAVAPD